MFRYKAAVYSEVAVANLAMDKMSGEGWKVISYTPLVIPSHTGDDGFSRRQTIQIHVCYCKFEKDYTLTPKAEIEI